MSLFLTGVQEKVFFSGFFLKALEIFFHVIIMSMTLCRRGEVEDFLEKCFHCVQLVRSQVFEEKKMIDLDQQSL